MAGGDVFRRAQLAKLESRQASISARPCGAQDLSAALSVCPCVLGFRFSLVLWIGSQHPGLSSSLTTPCPVLLSSPNHVACGASCVCVMVSAAAGHLGSACAGSPGTVAAWSIRYIPWSAPRHGAAHAHRPLRSLGCSPTLRLEPGWSCCSCVTGCLRADHMVPGPGP